MGVPQVPPPLGRSREWGNDQPPPPCTVNPTSGPDLRTRPPDPASKQIAYAESRFAAIFDDSAKISMNPCALDWSNVSPESYVARLKS